MQPDFKEPHEELTNNATSKNQEIFYGKGGTWRQLAGMTGNWISRKVAGNISVKGNTVSVLTDSEFKMLEEDLKQLGTDCKWNNGLKSLCFSI